MGEGLANELSGRIFYLLVTNERVSALSGDGAVFSLEAVIFHREPLYELIEMSGMIVYFCIK